MRKLQLVFLTIVLFACAVRAQVTFTPAAFQWINSQHDEQNPVLAPDGQTLYFTIRNHPQNIDGKRDPGDIWFSTWVDNRWSEPIHGGTLINDRGYNAIAGFSSDGSQMYLMNHYATSGQARTQGIAVSKKRAGTWSAPENISIPYFQNKSSIQSGHIAANGKVFVYSAETYGSHGVDDLYIVFKEADGKWSEPKNLGPVINTQFQELSPSFSADGQTLYYASNGRKGMGSFDIYQSTRLDDTFTNWTEPINMGPDYNSEGRELFFRSFESFGLVLFTSTTNSDGYGDIKYSIRDNPSTDSIVLVKITHRDSTSEPENAVTEEIDDGSIRIYGKVINARNGETIEASIRFEAPDNLTVVDAGSSGFSIHVPARLSYDIEVEADGYISTLERIDLSDFEMRELEMMFTLQPIEVGTSVNLKSVLFIQSKPELLPESYKELDLVVAFMKANPHVEIELAGHTDNRGSFRQLMDLSQKRVNRVKAYMVSRGIDKKRITGKGYGGSTPVAGNDTEEGRILNRRVEFIIRKS
jgi:OmpA-OmpF porin, OOP family